jgi:hypothetical protein
MTPNPTLSSTRFKEKWLMAGIQEWVFGRMLSLVLFYGFGGKRRSYDDGEIS